MSAARVLRRSVECRNKPRVRASLARCAFAIALIALSAFHFADPAAAQASAGHDVSVTGERAKQQFIADIAYISAPTSPMTCSRSAARSSSKARAPLPCSLAGIRLS